MIFCPRISTSVLYCRTERDAEEASLPYMVPPEVFGVLPHLPDCRECWTSREPSIIWDRPAYRFCCSLVREERSATYTDQHQKRAGRST